MTDASDDAGMTLTVERNDDVAVVTVGGELEFGTAGPLRTALLDLSQEGADLVLDLASVDFIDSTGISLLVQAKQRFDAQGHRFVLRAPATRVMRVLEISGLSQLFVIEDAASPS